MGHISPLVINFLEESSHVIAIATALQKGGSLQITIPQEVVKLLRLESGDRVMFVFHSKTKQIIIDKIERLTTPAGLTFSISKELAKQLLEKDEK